MIIGLMDWERVYVPTALCSHSTYVPTALCSHVSKKLFKFRPYCMIMNKIKHWGGHNAVLIGPSFCTRKIR